MSGVRIAPPDITLILDLDGIIRKVDLASSIDGERVESWVGRPWAETVGGDGLDDVRRLIQDARDTGVSAFRQFTQRFPSGLELPMEFTAVRLGGTAGLIAVGKNLQAVAELESRLVEAQQAIERDYWKLREVETRYQLLFDVANEPVLLITARDLRIVDANPAAQRSLGEAAVGGDLIDTVSPRDRAAFTAMLERASEKGKAPGMLVHLGHERRPWLVRASVIGSSGGPGFMLQLSALTGGGDTSVRSDPLRLEKLMALAPDGIVVVDEDGVILWANDAFLDLVQAASAAAVTGERLGRWLGRPGADLGVILANLRRHGMVRRFHTVLSGSLGGDLEVDISAAGDGDAVPSRVGLIVRELGHGGRSTDRAHGGLTESLGDFTRQVGKTPLRSLVGETVAMVERHYIEAALALTGGNRTAAAGVLGLSRQSLYAKLDRYGLDSSGGAQGERDE